MLIQFAAPNVSSSVHARALAHPRYHFSWTSLVLTVLSPPPSSHKPFRAPYGISFRLADIRCAFRSQKLAAAGSRIGPSFYGHLHVRAQARLMMGEESEN